MGLEEPQRNLADVQDQKSTGFKSHSLSLFVFLSLSAICFSLCASALYHAVFPSSASIIGLVIRYRPIIVKPCEYQLSSN